MTHKNNTICFIPPFQLPVTTTKQYVPLGILSIISYLKQHGIEGIMIVDPGRLLSLNETGMLSVDAIYGKIADYICLYESEVYAFSTNVGTYIQTICLAQYVKNRRPTSQILMGGPQATSTHKLTMEAFNFIDAVIRGEGERSVLNYLLWLKTDRRMNVPLSFTYRGEGGKVISTKDESLIEDLDELPLLDLDEYAETDSDQDRAANNILSYFPVDSSRGCMHGCSFCYSRGMWKNRVRNKSPNRVVEELRHNIKRYGISTCFFTDDCFTSDHDRVLEFCKLLKRESFKMSWFCYSRVDTINRSLLEAMRDAGCKQIYFGVESGDEDTLHRVIKKNSNLHIVKEIIENTLACKIIPIVSFIIGFPNETVEQVERTIRLFLKCMCWGAATKLHTLGLEYGARIYNDAKSCMELNKRMEYGDLFLLGEKQKKLIREHPQLFSFYYGVKTIYETDFISKFQVEFLFQVFRCTLLAVSEYGGGVLPLIARLHAWAGAPPAPRDALVEWFSTFLKSYLPSVSLPEFDSLRCKEYDVYTSRSGVIFQTN